MARHTTYIEVIQEDVDRANLVYNSEYSPYFYAIQRQFIPLESGRPFIAGTSKPLQKQLKNWKQNKNFKVGRYRLQMESDRDLMHP